MRRPSHLRNLFGQVDFQPKSSDKETQSFVLEPFLLMFLSDAGMGHRRKEIADQSYHLLNLHIFLFTHVHNRLVSNWYESPCTDINKNGIKFH